MMEVFFGAGIDNTADLRELELAAFGEWYVVAVLNQDCTAVTYYAAVEERDLLHGPYLRGVIAGTAEDGGPLTHIEALAARTLLQR